MFKFKIVKIKSIAHEKEKSQCYMLNYPSRKGKA